MSDRGLLRIRKAFASKGDDTTLTRFVREPVDHKPRNLQPRLAGIGTPAFVNEGRTKFGKAVRSVASMNNLLVSGHSNIKIGRDVRKGRLRGYWIYTLSLEERKTCPSSCAHWQTCYGNNMPFAKRIDHTSAGFLARLEAEIRRLLAMRGRRGILVRLHALGDFYSTEYVHFWCRMLAEHPNLAIYGYTARLSGTPIGWMVHQMNTLFGDRSMVRFSNDAAKMPRMSTTTIASPESCPPDAFVCPEQTGKALCCATCGACWSTQKNVAFWSIET